MTQEEYRERAKFVSELGTCLHQCGATSSRIELHLLRLCEMLGINGAFLYSPTGFTFSYWLDDPSDQLVQVKRLKPSGGDLGLLERIDDLMSRFEEHELTFEEMCEAFEEENRSIDYYNKPLQIAAWMITGTCFASLFSMNLVDGIAAGSIAVCVFFLICAISRFSRFSSTVEIVAAVMSGILATGIEALGLEINTSLVVLSSVVVLVPGLAVTVGLSEIAERDLVSGTSKLVDAVMCLFKLYFGALLGIGIGALAWVNFSGNLAWSLPLEAQWKILPLVMLLSLSVLIMLNIRFRLLFWCMASSMVGYFTTQYAGAAFGTVLGMFLGAFSVGVYSNWFANTLGKPASIVLIQGLIILVPGSKSYIVLNSWITGEAIISSGASLNEAFLTFISLVIGLLLANSILPSKKSL